MFWIVRTLAVMLSPVTPSPRVAPRVSSPFSYVSVTETLVAELTRRTSRVCPIECKGGETLKGETCVADEMPKAPATASRKKDDEEDENEQERDAQDPRAYGGECHEMTEVEKEGVAEGGQGSGDDHEHDRPSAEKRPERPVGLTHVHVQAPRPREHRAQLGQGQGTAEDEQAREDHPLCDETGDDEDPRADHGAHEQGGAVESGQLAVQLGPHGTASASPARAGTVSAGGELHGGRAQ